MKLEDFILQEGIHMPPSSFHAEEFAYSDGDEAEGYILQCVKQAEDVSDNSPELLRHARDWSSYYHLAPGRANHIRALNLPWDISVLELGAGCGAVSRHLGENHREVHSVEGSARRAMIARARCRGLDNVKVYCADFRKLALEPRYDLVLLNGVLEYAPVFFGGEGISPAEATANLLQQARSALNENGVLLVAIENKIGLKYWCGAPEDHTGKLFDGIHGYPTPGTAKTYSKAELTAVLQAAGFGFNQFYSCFPDYKFPVSIFADHKTSSEGFFLHNWVPYPAEQPGLSRNYFIHEGLAAKTVSEAGLIHEFANSFLVVSSARESVQFQHCLNPSWLATKASTANRDKTVHCMTRFFPATRSIEKTVINYSGGVARAESQLGHSVSSAHWVAGDLLGWEVARCVLSKNFKSDLPAILADYHAELLKRYATGETDEEGYPLLRGECFDFIMANIIRTPSGLEAIDEEWRLDEPLTVDYMLHRSLSQDCLGANKQWLGQNISDADGFIVAMTQTLYPRFTLQRHRKNCLLEYNNILKIRGTLGETAWAPLYKRAAWKTAIKTAADKLPPSIRRQIVKLSAKAHEYVLAVFDVA